MSGHSKWANIKNKKGRIDAIRGKVTTKISREITIAARMGGGDPVGNMRLKLALQKARQNNVPKDNIQRAIQKGLGNSDSGNFEELTYEGYGPAGVAVLVEIMTDNRNRTAADMRHIFSKHGGNLGESGCVGWMFSKQGLIVIDGKPGIDEEELMSLVIDAGAEDFKSEDGQYEVDTAVEDFTEVLDAIEKQNIEPSVAEITMVPQTTINLNGEDAGKMMRLIDELEEHDDVQNVYANYEIEDEDEE